MNRGRAVVALVCCAIALVTASAAPDDGVTLAVFGDWPYSAALLAAAPRLLASINGDPAVSVVIHVGDIQSAATPCTGGGLTQAPPRADPRWSAAIFTIFEQFEAPLIYTPGDNEWTDCHRHSGAPLEELAALRARFFPTPGSTLGRRKMAVSSQAQAFDPAHPGDAQFVENVMWEAGHVVFATVHVPGSNNDGMRWRPPFTDERARTRAVAERTGAAIRWLRRAFTRAGTTHAAGVLIALHADMWTVGVLGGYTPFVKELAMLSAAFGKPVLLVNGDTHVFRVERPFADPLSLSSMLHETEAAPNLTRITVQGALEAPREWLRVTVDPRTTEVFSWRNVVYCDDTSCPR
jgi:hypothetical protein